MLIIRHLLLLFLGLLCLCTSAQRGLIIEPASSNVMDPNGDGYVSLTNAGFSNDGYYVDEYELAMFPLPVFGDGDTVNDTQAGGNCGTTDLTIDSEGNSAYAVLDANNNLIFRLRLANERPSVEAYTILIDTDGKLGADDPNANGINAGFEIDITLIKSASQGIFVYDIDGIVSCPTPILEYDMADNFQLSIADVVSCGDQDYFYDFYVPFGDLETAFNIDVDSKLQFIVVTNISGTCAMAGKISDIGGVDDNNYGGCIECAFEDLASNQCPVPFSSLSAGGGGFLSGATQTPTMEVPLKEGDLVIQGTAEPTAELFLDLFDLNENLISQETAITDANGDWIINLGAPLVQGDSVTAVAQIAGSCDSGVTGSQLSFAVVVLNTTPFINGTGTDLNYSENDGLVSVDDAVVFGDNEDLDLVSATISFAPGYEPTEDALNFTNQNGITGSYNSGTGVLTLTGDATIQDYTTAAQSVTYSNSSEDPIETQRIVEFIINDGTENSLPFSRNINVSKVNDAPVLSGTPGSTEYKNPTPFIVNNTMSITDLDNTLLSSASALIIESASGNFIDGDELSFINPPGITGNYNSTTGILSFSGVGTLADYASALNNVEYEYSPPGTAVETTRRIEFSISDGSATSNLLNHFITFPASTNFPPEVIDGNGGPVINVINILTNEDQTVEVCLTVSDPDGDLVAIDTDPPNTPTAINGTIIFTGDLCFEYVPDPDFSGTETIVITVCDAVGNCDATPVDIIITTNPINDPPVLAPSSETVNERETTSICIDITDITDVEGDDHEFTTGISSNNATITDGTAGDLCFDYNPEVGFIGMDQVEVTICDSNDPAICTTGTIDVTVLSVNDEPIILVNGIATNTMTIDVFEDIPQDICFEVVDVDGDDVSTVLPLVNVENDGSTLIETATEFCYNYVPVLNANGTSTWNVTVIDDGTGTLTNQVEITINILPVNDQPTLTDITDPAAILEDAGQQTVNLSGITAGGGETQTLTVTAVSSNTALIPDPTVNYTSPNGTGSLAYTPVADQSGTAVITVTVDDGEAANNTVVKTFNVAVTAVNDQPTLTDITDPAAILEDAGQQTVNLSGITAGGGETQTLTVTAVSSNTALIPDPTVNYTSPNGTGSLAYTPVADQSGTAVITVTVDDGEAANNTVVKTFNVAVTAVNDQPTLTDITDPAAILEDAGQQTVNLSGITAGGGETQTLTVTAVSSNTALIPDPTVNYTSPNGTGSLAYTPVADQSGTAVITVTVDDGEAANNTVVKTFNVAVTAVNDQPTLTDITDPAAILEDAGQQTTDFSGISAGGGENQSLLVSAISNNPGLIPNPTVSYTSPNVTGSLSYVPEPNQHGTATITITVDDQQSSNNTIQKTYNILVNPFNDAAVIDATTIEVDEKVTTSICVPFNDIENDLQVFKNGASLTANATITDVTTGDLCFDYTPPDGFIGLDQVEVTICDENDPLICTTGIIDINVIDINEPPVLKVNGLITNNLTLQGLEDELLDFCLEMEDPEGDDVSTLDFTNLIGGGLLTEGNSLCYQFNPELNMFGAVTWEITVCDNGVPQQCNTVYVDIDISNVNDAPVALNDTLVVLRKAEGSINVLDNDQDIDNEQLRLNTTLIEAPIGGTAKVSSDGTITYVSNVTFRGVDQLTYSVEDLGSPTGTSIGTLIIRVDDEPFTVYQTISPNGDGFNDYWHIEGIDFYPNNTVKLYDRYNNLVFEMNGYDNVSKVWQGKSNRNGSSQLPEGTYYYRITAGEAGTFGGFVVLRGTSN